jgi:hypothetical protein
MCHPHLWSFFWRKIPQKLPGKHHLLSSLSLRPPGFTLRFAWLLPTWSIHFLTGLEGNLSNTRPVVKHFMGLCLQNMLATPTGAAPENGDSLAQSDFQLLSAFTFHAKEPSLVK